MTADRKHRVELGWAELVDLPDLGIANLPAKIDTGARTSSLHAIRMRIIQAGDGERVRFTVKPDRDSRPIRLEMAVVERRRVRSSNGLHEDRPVVRTRLCLGGIEREVEVTLTRRGTMRFQMLVGRTALRRHYIVNCGRTFVTRNADDLARDVAESSEKEGR